MKKRKDAKSKKTQNKTTSLELRDINDMELAVDLDISHPVAFNITKATFEKLLNTKNKAPVIALYMFYLYTYTWQLLKYGTTDLKATSSYAAKGLDWSELTIRKHKKTLVQLGLIEDVQKRDDKGQIIGHYIRLKYRIAHPARMFTDSVSLEVAKVTTNTKENSNTNTKREHCEKTQRHNLASDLKSTKDDKFFKKTTEVLISSIVKMNPKIRGNKVNRETWNKQLQLLHRKDGVKKKEIKRVLLWYKRHCNGEFSPKLRHFNAKHIRTKWQQIIDARVRYYKENGEAAVTETEQIEERTEIKNGKEIIRRRIKRD